MVSTTIQRNELRRVHDAVASGLIDWLTTVGLVPAQLAGRGRGLRTRGRGPTHEPPRSAKQGPKSECIAQLRNTTTPPLTSDCGRRFGAALPSQLPMPAETRVAHHRRS